MATTGKLTLTVGNLYNSTSLMFVNAVNIPGFAAGAKIELDIKVGDNVNFTTSRYKRDYNQKWSIAGTGIENIIRNGTPKTCACTIKSVPAILSVYNSDSNLNIGVKYISNSPVASDEFNYQVQLIAAKSDGSTVSVIYDSYQNQLLSNVEVEVVAGLSESVINDLKSTAKYIILQVNIGADDLGQSYDTFSVSGNKGSVVKTEKSDGVIKLYYDISTFLNQDLDLHIVNTADPRITINQLPHQTIIVTVDGVAHTSTFTAATGKTYTATIKAIDGYKPGTLSSTSGTVNKNITISATSASIYNTFKYVTENNLVPAIKLTRVRDSKSYTINTGKTLEIPDLAVNDIIVAETSAEEFAKWNITATHGVDAISNREDNTITFTIKSLPVTVN